VKSSFFEHEAAKSFSVNNAAMTVYDHERFAMHYNNIIVLKGKITK